LSVFRSFEKKIGGTLKVVPEETKASLSTL